MRRRHPQGPADSDHHDRAFVSPLQQVLHFGVCDLGRVSGHGHHPPHLASAVSAFLGATGCARLGRCAVGWPHFVPTGLRGEDLQRWAADHWPAAEKKLEGGWPFLAGAKLMQQPGDRLMMLDTAFAAFARDPCALCSFDPQGRLPLHVAARRSGHAMLVQLLLDLQAEVDAVGQIDGRTALHCACAAGDAQSVRCLLAARADPQRRDHLRMLPLDVAARLRAEEAQEVLLATMVPHSSTCANTGRCHVS
ncbi:unnamed protein product [Durusdinium trenchii]|uniref:Uncharacterized protein n=1 Tax=Durusdinium trenchii TaxID=1381693 RepID=A0ABP0IY62_9DINO